MNASTDAYSAVQRLLTSAPLPPDVGPAAQLRSQAAAKRQEAEALHSEADHLDAAADLQVRLVAATDAVTLAELSVEQAQTVVVETAARLAKADEAVGDLRQQLADLDAVENPDRNLRAMSVVVREDLAAAVAARLAPADAHQAATRDLRQAQNALDAARRDLTEAQARQGHPLTGYDTDASLARLVRICWPTLLAARAGQAVDDEELAMCRLVALTMFAATGLANSVGTAAERAGYERALTDMRNPTYFPPNWRTQ